MEDINNVLSKQKHYFYSHATKDINFRLKSLRNLKKVIKSNENLILSALKIDLNKSDFEAYLTEIGTVLDEINYTIKNLKKWCKYKRVKTHYMHFLSKSYIYHEPYGVSLIISPWNYPFQLAMMPLIGSIAAGNCAMLKPSEYSVETSKILFKIISECFDEQYVAVILGGVEESNYLLNADFDHIFFTGSIEVGKIVMEAASKRLIPIVLELGGKSPCIIDETANIKYAAKRIIWGKCLNSGQTCVAPDYILVHKKVKKDLIKYMIFYIKEFFGENPLTSKDLSKIINEKHFNRLLNYIKESGILYGGKYNKNDLMIEPTIIDNVKIDDIIMKEEIFGPLLPCIEFQSLNEVFSIVRKNPNPLALYIFSENEINIKTLIERISFGGGCINDTIMHLSTPYLSFGGVKQSGSGSYHGKGSFEAFSHKKSIFKQTNLFDIPIRYAPYKDKIKIIKKLLK